MSPVRRCCRVRGSSGTLAFVMTIHRVCPGHFPTSLDSVQHYPTSSRPEPRRPPALILPMLVTPLQGGP